MAYVKNDQWIEQEFTQREDPIPERETRVPLQFKIKGFFDIRPVID
jgi:hypothetical protein